MSRTERDDQLRRLNREASHGQEEDRQGQIQKYRRIVQEEEDGEEGECS